RPQSVHDRLHETITHFLQLALLAETFLERIRRRLQLEQAANASAEHEPIVRLREEVVTTRFDRLHAVGRVVQRGHEYDRNILRPRIALDATTDLEPRRAIVATEITGGHRHRENAEIWLAPRT